MTFTLLCPSCGHAIGSGYHTSYDDGTENTTFNVTARSNPPCVPAPEKKPPTHTPKKDTK
jgi:hypothetical protein